MEEVLEWFNHPHASAHPRCAVTYQGLPNRPALSLRPCFVKASAMVEKVTIMLESKLTRSLVANNCHLQYENFVQHCKQGYGWLYVKLFCQMSLYLKRIRMIVVMHM